MKILYKMYKLNLEFNVRMAKKILSSHGSFMDYYTALIFKEINKSHTIILEVGCGGGHDSIDFRGKAKKVFGLDIDSNKLEINPYIEEGIVADVCSIPSMDNEVIDIIISKDLFEHIAEPALMLKELHRILKPNRKIIFKTPNKKSIFGLFTNITPYWGQKLYWKMTLSDYPDVTPTYYRFNDKKTIEDLAVRSGFVVYDIAYFCSMPPAPSFLPCVLYVPYCLFLKAVNSLYFSKHYSDVIVCVLKKQSESRGK